MRTLRTIFRSLVLGAAVAATVGTPAISHASAIFISIGPPAVPVYERPYYPGAGYVWVDGYYAWGDDGYYWVPGYWTLPPYESAIWQPGVWGYGGGGWGWTAGFWAHPVGYWGGVYYSRPWPWYGSYGICHEGWYRNSFYGRNYYNNWYNDRWGRQHGRDFDDRRWEQTRNRENHFDGNGGRGDHGWNNGRSVNNAVNNHVIVNGQRGYDARGVNQNRGLGNDRAGNNAVNNHVIVNGQRPLITTNGANNPSANRGQSYANRGQQVYPNRPSYQGGAHPTYAPQTGNNVYRPQQNKGGMSRPPANYGGGQHYNAPQAYGGGMSRPRASYGSVQHSSAPPAYGGGQHQPYSGGQHYSAPQARYSGGGNGGGSHGGGSQHGR